MLYIAIACEKALYVEKKTDFKDLRMAWIRKDLEDI